MKSGMITRRLLLVAIAALALATTPAGAEAQGGGCNQKCQSVGNEEGQIIGYGCVIGGFFTNCVATSSGCDFDRCTVSVLHAEDGATLAILPGCELDQAARYIARGSDVYIAERYLNVGDAQ